MTKKEYLFIRRGNSILAMSSERNCPGDLYLRGNEQYNKVFRSLVSLLMLFLIMF